MRMRTLEISVGAFVLAGMLAVLFLVIQVSGVNMNTSETSYVVSARFDDVAGLRPRAKVSMAGVTLGRVKSIEVDTDYGEAIVRIEIDGEPGSLTTDTSAKVLTEGILGARYIGLLPGSDDTKLKDGGEITETQGAIVLENLIGQFLTTLGKD